jgi:hypothetical protein
LAAILRQIDQWLQMKRLGHGLFLFNASRHPQ